MHSTRHDSNLAALQAGAGLPGHVVDVVVLTADPGLLATLRDASGPEHAIWNAASADAAVDLLVDGRCSVLVADLGTLRGDAAALLDRLHAQFPELVLLATGRRDEEHAVASLVSDGRIYRFLHKPISPARATLFLTAASRRYNELRSAEPLALTTVKTIAARPNFARIVAAIVAVAAIIVAAAVWFGREQPDVTTKARNDGTLTRQEQIADYLGRAHIALATGRLTEPRGNNALEYFRDVLALQPDNVDARAGVERVVTQLEARLVEALQTRDPARGAAALTTLQHAQPDHPRLDALREQLLTISRSAHPLPTHPPAATPSTARPTPAPVKENKKPVAPPPERVPDEAPAQPRVQAAPAQTAPAQVAPEPAAPPSPIAEELASIARLRTRGALIEPADTNAYDQLLALRERFPQSGELRTEQQQLAFAMLERTRTALAAGDVDTAAAFLSRVDTLLPGMTATKGLQAQLAAAQQQRDFNKNVFPAATLKRVREVPPVYPKDAQRNGIEGWVDVEFTVAPDGTTRDLTVRGAQPPNVFESAALDSVSKWRFTPIVRNGVPAAQRASIRVRFQVRD